MLSLLLSSLLLIFLFMNLAFLVAYFLKRNDLADIAWGMGFIVVAGYFLLTGSLFSFRQILVFALVLLWGLRLTIYIFARNKGKPEDFRYREWREKWGKKVLIKSYLQVFILQGFFMFLISLPVVMAQKYGIAPINFLDWLGVAVWLVGFFFETIGDWQMYQFKELSANKGKIMTNGLWAYTRHPNYFGEVTMWWGIFLISVSSGYWWLSVIGPLTISILILKVSGIPLLEKKYQGNKEFEEYKKKVSAFFPLPPKK